MQLIPSWLLPAFLVFGPLYIVIAPSRPQAMVGALMLSLGVTALFVKVTRLERDMAARRSGEPSSKQ